MITSDVRIWGVRRNQSSKSTSYEVRWIVAGRPRSRTRRTKALADDLLSDLRQAARSGEPFDLDTGLPLRYWRAETPIVELVISEDQVVRKTGRA